MPNLTMLNILPSYLIMLLVCDYLRSSIQRGLLHYTRCSAIKVLSASFMRVDEEVLLYFKAQGRGWQTRMNEALKTLIAEHRV